ncbi:MAG TPA: pilus assembly protein TadG-related protein [Candidatus Sulfotelmatobacter sp.]|nr:pilus assembly protein TadG-related protein [Candidatus Sulfotelmatobacter sp.]
MILVALAMVAIIAMAALSIDVITLYLAREEAQRSADSAALAAAKIIALSGLTGDPSNLSLQWGAVCGPDDGTNGLATRVAKTVAGQNTVGSIAADAVTVNYFSGTGSTMGSGTSDCTTLSSTAFGVNPVVNVQVRRTSMPTFFSRIWGNTSNSVSATATAEAFNSSNSGNVGNETTGSITPVQPRCVKPWVVPNLDPLSSAGCNGNCTPFVNSSTGAINRQGISLGGAGAAGVIGETFWLEPDCQSAGSNCTLLNPGSIQPTANTALGTYGNPNLLYVPNQVGTPVIAVPSCRVGDASTALEQAIAGCDQPTNYSCGVVNANVVDMSTNPRSQTTDAVQCLIQQGDTGDVTASSGQDYFNPFGAPASYPYPILAGSSNPTGLSGTQISTSASIVSLPIYDNSKTINGVGQTNVTFVGFLQVFINAVDANGNLNVTVLNVSGCSNGSGSVGTPVIGNSPVPVRLITPP